MDNHGFTLVGGLREIDIGPGDRTKPTYVNAKSNPEYELELMDLLKEVQRFFLLNEMLGLG